MTMTMTRPHSGLAAQAADRDRERRTADITRRRRTEFLHLPYCRICGGATEVPVDVADPDELRCVCAARTADLEARIRRLAGHAPAETVDITEPRRAVG